MSLHPKLKSSLVFLAKLLVTIVPAFFVYRNIVSAPDWDISDLYRLFSVEGILPFTFALVCLAASNFTACLQWKLLLERQGVPSFTTWGCSSTTLCPAMWAAT